MASSPTAAPVAIDSRGTLHNGIVGVTVRRALLYALPALAVLVVGLPTMILPFWSDNAIFAVMGATIWRGGFPYVDAWDQKPPSIYFIYALAIHGPLGIMRNVRLFDLIWTVTTVVALVELGRRWWTPRAGVISGLSYGIVYVTISTWTQLAQPDSFIGLPLVVALLLVQIGRGRGPLLLAAGICLGFAFQLRAIMALLVPFFTLPEVLSAEPGRRVGVWYRSMLWLASGFTIFQGAVALYLLAGAALGEYAAATRFAAGYTRLGGPWQGPDGPTTEDYLQTLRLSFVYWALARLVLTVPAIVGGGYGALLRHERRVQQLVLFVVLAYAGIATQAKFFWYHYAYMLPFLALLAGWSWDSLLTALRRVHGRVTTAAVGGLLLAVLLVSTPEMLDHGLHQWDDALRYYRHPEQRESFDAQFYGYDASRQAGWYLQQHTRPDEAIYVWGYDPLVYLLADRPFASRFIYAFPMMSTWAPPAWRQEFLDDMHAHPPIYFITQHNQGGPWITGHSIDPADYVAWFPPLQEWLLANYDLETTIGDFLIYRRRS